MARIIVDGVYENGKVELTEPPKGVERARVRVTFLTEASTKRKKRAENLGRPAVQGEASAVTADPYPRALRDEYKALIHKKINGAMTDTEAARLEAVRAEINLRDSRSESWLAWQQRAAEVDEELSGLRRELEALPNA